MTNKLQTDRLADRVKKILKNHPESRTNNRLVQFHIWNDELRALGKRQEQFLYLYVNGKLSSAEGIRRRIPEVKKAHPELSGGDTLDAEESMKRDLGYPVNGEGQFEFGFKT